MHVDHQESPCQRCTLHREVKTTSFTGQVDAVVPPPSSGHKCYSLHRTTLALCSMSALGGIIEHPSIKV